MRKNIVAGNWKMNMDYEQGISLFSEIVNMVKDEVIGNQEVVVCSPFIHLAAISKLSAHTNNVSIGAQTINQHESGAYTGEISASQVKSTGAEYVILGHSERRAYFGETDELLAEKVDAALKHGLKPIFCIGETQSEREAGSYFEVIKNQLSKALFHLDAAAFGNIVLAYEPVWAIGTGKTATPEEADAVHDFIHCTLMKYSDKICDLVRVVYGGSVNASNVESLFAKDNIDGALVGGASLEAEGFTKIALA